MINQLKLTWNKKDPFMVFSLKYNTQVCDLYNMSHSIFDPCKSTLCKHVILQQARCGAIEQCSDSSSKCGRPSLESMLKAYH